MAKAKNKGATTAKMYRHFAVITVLLTAGIAVFADTDQQEDAQARMIAQEEKARAAGQKVKKYGDPKLVNKFESSDGPQQRTSGSFDDSVPDAGQPMTDLSSDGADSSFLPGNLPQHQRMAVPTGFNPQLGISDDELANLSEEARKKLIEQIRKGRYGENPEKRQRQIEELLRQSRERSGGPADGEGIFG